MSLKAWIEPYESERSATISARLDWHPNKDEYQGTVLGESRAESPLLLLGLASEHPHEEVETGRMSSSPFTLSISQ